MTSMPTAEVGRLLAANFARDWDDVRPAELTRTVDEWADLHPQPPGQVRRPLSVFEGVLYDGHTRYTRARAAGQAELPVVGPDDFRFNW